MKREKVDNMKINVLLDCVVKLGIMVIIIKSILYEII